MKTVITGGAGFIGCNLAAHAMRAGDQVVVLDNLARPGAAANAQWLATLGGDLSVIHADVRDYQAVRAAVRDAYAARGWAPPTFLDAPPSAGARRIR